MSQLLLFPDPRPLVERLGATFFRSAPECPGVYLMRDQQDTVLYVGKAKNLRKRLGSYRVANPDRVPRRHLRLLRSVARIELERCTDEASALNREAELLRSLRPRFNRAGTWPGNPKYLLWRKTESAFELAIHAEESANWLGGQKPRNGLVYVRSALARLLWCGLWPERGYAGLPAGWFRGRADEVLVLRCEGVAAQTAHSAQVQLATWFAGNSDPLIAWIRERTASAPLFDLSALEADLEYTSHRHGDKPQVAPTAQSAMSPAA